MINRPEKFDLNRKQNWEREDESNDNYFYTFPRLVVHVDDYFVQSLGKFFSSRLKSGAVILDIMSSYKTHLPSSREYQPGRVVGLGMNGAELEANDQLDEYLIQDLNADPRLPFEDGLFDAVLNNVSVQYLTRPVEVFKEVGRVLKPGGNYIVSFSNRMFPTKAVRLWRELDEAGRVGLVKEYFKEARVFEEPEVFEDISPARPGFFGFGANSSYHDPVYIVSARRKHLKGQNSKGEKWDE